MYPFESRTKLYGREKIKRRVICAVSFTILSVIFIWGMLTVYINCYNSMNSEPIKVLEYQKDDDEIKIILLGKEYLIKS